MQDGTMTRKMVLDLRSGKMLTWTRAQLKEWRHDIQHDTTQHNDVQHNSCQYSDTRHNITQHNGIQHNGSQYSHTQHEGLIFWLSALRVDF